MKFLSAILLALSLVTLEADGQSRPVRTVPTMADLQIREGIPGEAVDVLARSTNHPAFSRPRRFNEYSTNEVTNPHDGTHYITNGLGRVYVSQDRFDSEQDVTWFGAIMTNTVDSSAAIQAAINYGADDDFYPATGRRGITVLIPAGELLVTNSIQLKAGTRLIGAGHENTVIFTAITNADTIYYNDTVAGISVVPEVSGLAINQTTNAVPTAGAGIHFYATLPGTSVSPLVRDVLIRKTYRGIVIDTAFQGLLDHVRAFSCVDDGFRIEQSADGIDSTSTTFLSCYAAANGGDGYDLIGSYHTLLGCASDSNGGYGYRGNRSAAGYTLSNVTFNSCGAEANTLGGAYLLGAFATRFEGTIYGISGNGHGITVDSGSGITISGRISSISATNVWGVFLKDSLGYYPNKVSILTDEIGDFGNGRISHPELVAHLSDSWKGAYPAVIYGTRPNALPAGLTLAPTLPGTNGFNIGTYNTPYFSQPAASFMTAEYVGMRYGFTNAQTLAAARIVTTPTGATGNIAYQIGDWYQVTDNGTSANAAIWIGNAYPASGNYSLAVTTTNEARFAGLVSGTTVRSTDASAVTKAEMTTDGYVKAPFFHTTATNLTTAQPLIKIGENTRYQQEGVVQVGGLLDFWFNPTNTTAAQYGLDISYRANPLTQIGNTYGINLTGYAQTAATVGSLYGIGLNATVSGGGTVNTLAGAVIFNPILTSGTINNSFGLLIADQTAGAANHAIYTGLGKVYHGDTFEVGATKAIIFGGVSRTNWPFYDGVAPNANVLALSTATGGSAGRVLSYVDSTTFAWSNAPSSFSFADLTNAVRPGANVTFNYTSTNFTVDAASSSGATNGTPVSVDGGATLSAANFADGSRVGFSASGTNVTADIVANSIRTNELATAAVSYLLDRGNHTGTQNWSTITGTPTTLSGYGITDGQLLDADLTRIANVTWALGDIVYRDATGLTNFATTAAGRALMNAVDDVDQLTLLNLIGGTPTEIDSVARTTVRKNTGANVGSRRRLNFIEGSNVTLTVADDAGGEEVDVTIAASGGGGGTAVLVNGTNVSNPNFRRFFGISDSTNVDLLLSAGANITFTTNSGVLEISGASGSGDIRTTTAVSANYTATDSDSVIWANATTANITVTLPASPTDGRFYTIIKTGGIWDVIVDDNTTTHTMDTTGESITLVYISGYGYFSFGIQGGTASLTSLRVNGTAGVTNLVDSTTATWTKTNGTAAVNIATVSTSGAGLAPQITSSNAVFTSSATGVPEWTPNRVTKTIATFRAQQGEPPISSYATLSTRNGIGTLLYDEAVFTSTRFRWMVPEGYNLTNVTVVLKWTTSATSGDGTWVVKNAKLTGDIDSLSFGTAVTNTVTTSGTAGTVMTSTLTGVTVSSPAAGDWIYTDVARIDDTINSNDLELHAVEVRAE